MPGLYEPKRIQLITFMWCTGSESIRNVSLNLDRQPVFTFGSAGNDGCEPVLILTPNFTWAEPNA